MIDGRMYESRMKKNVRIHRHTDRQSRLDRYVSSGRILHAFFWFEMVRTRISPCPSPETSHCSPHSGDLIPRVASQLCDSFFGSRWRGHGIPPTLSVPEVFTVVLPALDN